MVLEYNIGLMLSFGVFGIYRYNDLFVVVGYLYLEGRSNNLIFIIFVIIMKLIYSFYGIYFLLLGEGIGDFFLLC